MTKELGMDIVDIGSFFKKYTEHFLEIIKSEKCGKKNVLHFNENGTIFLLL